MMINFACGLKKLGIVEQIDAEGYSKVDKSPLECLAIYSRNCYQWVVAEYGSFYNNYTIVPLYDTLGIESVKLVLVEVGFSAAICDNNGISNIVELLEKDKVGKLHTLISIDPVSDELKARINNLQIKLYSFEQILEEGKNIRYDPCLPTHTDIALILYTSGSTGVPKGVILYHQTLSSLAQSSQLHDERTSAKEGDFHLSYLPLPHSFEQFLEANVLSGGGAIGFSNGDKKLVLDDVAVLRPTVFASVPRIYTRMQDSIIKTVNKKGGVVKRLFDNGVKAKYDGFEKGLLNHSFYDKIVFSKIKAKIGFDRLRWAISGSAPLPKETIKFLRAVLGVPFFEGYGMTETGGGICCGELDDVSRFGNCGGPVHACEIRLVSVPELNYYVTDKEHVKNDEKIICNGRGEICLRGFNVTPGYFKRPDLTKEVIDEDGWLHTGDIGLWDDKKTIHIIDRKKNIVKLSQGEYIAVESLENVYL